MKVEQSLIEAYIRATGRPLRIDGLTFYLRMGQLCCQESQRERVSGRKWQKTEARERTKLFFMAMRWVCSQMKEALGDLPVWRVARQLYAPRMSADNYMHSVLSPYYNVRGWVQDFENLTVSVGELAPARGMKAAWVDGQVTLTWEFEAGMPHAEGTDVLHVLLVREWAAGIPVLVKGLEARRRDGVVSFPFEFNKAGVLHVYPFWGREDETAFSRNVHFALTGEPPAAESPAGKVTTGKSC